MTSTGNRTRVARMVAQWFNHYATATQCNQPHYNATGNYMFKVINRDTKTKCEICSKLAIKTPERNIKIMYCWLMDTSL